MEGKRHKGARLASDYQTQQMDAAGRTQEILEQLDAFPFVGLRQCRTEGRVPDRDHSTADKPKVLMLVRPDTWIEARVQTIGHLIDYSVLVMNAQNPDAAPRQLLQAPQNTRDCVTLDRSIVYLPDGGVQTLFKHRSFSDGMLYASQLTSTDYVHPRPRSKQGADNPDRLMDPANEPGMPHPNE